MEVVKRTFSLRCAFSPFVLYIFFRKCINIVVYVHNVFYVSERVQLKRTDYPLVVRILQGPCEHVCKIFLMEQDLGEEIPYEVSVYV